MSAKPILFSAPMIHALMAGNKTQTRRLVKPQPPGWAEGCYRRPDGRWIWVTGPRPDNGGGEGVALDNSPFLCPYGRPGDLLYVRESWRTEANRHDAFAPSVLDGTEPVLFDADGDWSLNHTVGRRRAAMHMPRWASRLTLRITDVRAQRLQEVSERDAEAEGIVRFRPADADGRRYFGLAGDTGDGEPTAARAYRHLWNAINGADAWDSNPWVWAVSFEVNRANVDQVLKEAA